MWQREELRDYLSAGYFNSVLTEETLAFSGLSEIPLHVQSPISKAKLGKLG